MSKSKNLFKNINFAILGLVVMATSTALIDLAGAFKTIATVLLANLALHFISWLLICFSTYKMQNLDKRYKIGLYLSIAGEILLIGGSFFMFKEYRLFGIIGFTSIQGMFFKYLSDLVMLGIYFLLIESLYQIKTRGKDGTGSNKALKRTKIFIVLILIAMMFTPFAYIFSKPIKYVLVVIFVGVGVFLKFSMISFLNRSYSQFAEK